MNLRNLHTMIKAKDIVKIKPEYQDKGDETLVWVALEDEDGGRVRISPLNTGMAFPPNQIVNTGMLDKADLHYPIKE